MFYVPQLLSCVCISVHKMDCLREETVSVPGMLMFFWCSELCRVDKEATVQRGSVLGVRCPELFLWKVELPQLAKEVQPLLGLFDDGVKVSVPLQILRDSGAQESECLHY